MGLVISVQWFLVGTGGMSTATAVSIPFLLAALIVPIPAYAWAFRNAELGFETSHRGVRTALIGLVAIILSLVGFAIGLAFFASRVRVK